MNAKVQTTVQLPNTNLRELVSSFPFQRRIKKRLLYVTYNNGKTSYNLTGEVDLDKVVGVVTEVSIVADDTLALTLEFNEKGQKLFKHLYDFDNHYSMGCMSMRRSNEEVADLKQFTVKPQITYSVKK